MTGYSPWGCKESDMTEKLRMAQPKGEVVKDLPRWIPPASARDIRDVGSIPGLGRYSGGEHGNPLQYSYLENLHGQRSLAGHSI